MRVLHFYRFHYGTKLPFSEIPDRIHRFLSSQGLKSGRFMYFFEDIASFSPSEKTEEGAKCVFSTHGCERIRKDCPELGSVRTRTAGYDRYSFLTNLDGEPFPEEKLLPLMGRIHKRYGFFAANLYYADIDFFGETVLYEPAPIRGEDRDPDAFDPFACWSMYESPNPGIEVYRCALTADNYISLSIDALADGKLRDTTPYYDALRAVLPRMRSYHETVLRPTREEQAAIDSGDRKAAPLLEECRRFFSGRMPADYKPTEENECSGLAKAMKSMAGASGYSFRRAGNGDYKAAKRTARNAAIYAELSVTRNPEPLLRGRSLWQSPWQGVSLIVSFQGAGFRHELFCDMDIPRNRGAILARWQEVLAVIGEFEKTHLPALDLCYAVTPDWFVPSAYWDKEYGGYHY